MNAGGGRSATTYYGRISVKRLYPSGALRLSRDGFSLVLFGYSVRDALSIFRHAAGVRS